MKIRCEACKRFYEECCGDDNFETNLCYYCFEESLEAYEDERHLRRAENELIELRRAENELIE